MLLAWSAVRGRTVTVAVRRRDVCSLRSRTEWHRGFRPGALTLTVSCGASAGGCSTAGGLGRDGMQGRPGRSGQVSPAGTIKGYTMRPLWVNEESGRRGRRVAVLLSAAALVLAACGADEAGETGEEVDDPAGEEDVDDGDDDGSDNDDGDNGDEARGDGDPEASTVTVDGEDAELHFAQCQEQFEHEAVEIRVRGYDPRNPDHDPELELVLSIDENPQDEGVARTPELRREPVELEEEFDGHRWEPVEGSDPIEIDWDGTSAEREFEIIEVGDDEPDGEQGDAMDVAFDLVC